MMNLGSNLRKAAVLIRSLDADSAAGLLAQLSQAEAASVREAIRALGPIDPDEQADLLSEFRRVRPLALEPARRGVELSLSKPAHDRELQAAAEPQPRSDIGRRFDFLENAPMSVLVTHLAREHAQTIAVVLSQLAPAHAAEVLAALPEKVQALTIERLSVLGETDTESIAVLESELAAWVARRIGGRAERGQRRETMAAILAAATGKTREAILTRLHTDSTESVRSGSKKLSSEPPVLSGRDKPADWQMTASRRFPWSPLPSPQPPPSIDFDHLIHFDDRTLAAVLREVDGNALALALAGSGDELVDRICRQMPKRTAKSFRRELRRLGPTRLSDVETAQRLVANHAAQLLARRRAEPAGQIQ